MKAKTKPLDLHSPERSRWRRRTRASRCTKTEPPPGRQRGIMVKDAAELFAELPSGVSYEQDTHRRRTRGRQAQRVHRQMRQGRHGARRQRNRGRRVRRSGLAGAPRRPRRLAGVTRVLDVAHAAQRTCARRDAGAAGRRAREPFTHVFGPSTTFGKDLMPRVAALLDAPQVSDVMAIESATRFRRPIYAGNAITTVEVAAGTSRSSPRSARHRSKRWPPAEPPRSKRSRRRPRCRRTRVSFRWPRPAAIAQICRAPRE